MFATILRYCSLRDSAKAPINFPVNIVATAVAAVPIIPKEETMASPLTESIPFAKENIEAAREEVAPEALFARSIQLRNEFSIVFQPRLTVFGSFSYSSFTLTKPACKAGITTSVVSLPSPAILRNSPVVLPSPSATACMMRGACSFTELNSWPRSTPDSRACLSCTMALLYDSVDAPETIAALPSPSVREIRSFCEMFRLRVERASPK